MSFKLRASHLLGRCLLFGSHLQLPDGLFISSFYSLFKINIDIYVCDFLLEF
jgi:hypothetical protein